jgi:serine phosphatase RsbU (regulator of sigma subunit)
VTEARNASGEFYGEESVRRFLECQPPTLSGEELAARLRVEVQAFAGATELEDDMTLMVVRVPEAVAALT